MKLTRYLKQWPYTEAQLKRILSTLESGRVVRTTYMPEIQCIYTSNGYTVIEIDANGVEREKEFSEL